MGGSVQIKKSHCLCSLRGLYRDLAIYTKCSLALIPDIDEFEKIYVCSRCGKEFSYPPGLSRADNESFVCRICGAEEAMIAAGASEEQMSAVLEEIRRHEE